jgi:hypothetical protein
MEPVGQIRVERRLAAILAAADRLDDAGPLPGNFRVDDFGAQCPEPAERVFLVGLNHPRIARHVGINVGDIVVEDGDIFGDGGTPFALIGIAHFLSAEATPRDPGRSNLLVFVSLSRRLLRAYGSAR